MTYLSLGIVGYGAVAQLHAGASFLHRRARLVGVYGPDPSRAQSFADVVGARLATSDIERLIESVDALIICSPSPLHGEQTRRAIALGRHVLTEIPVAGSIEEARDIALRARTRAVIAAATHTARLLPAVTTIARVVEASEIGRPKRVMIDRTVRLRERTWTDDALAHHALHALECLRLWFEQVEPVAAELKPASGPVQDVALVLRAGDDVSCDVRITYGTHPDEQRIVVDGTHGRITSDGFGHVRVMRDGSESVALDIPLAEAYSSAIVRQDGDFIDRVLEARADRTFEDTIGLMELIERVKGIASRG